LKAIGLFFSLALACSLVPARPVHATDYKSATMAVEDRAYIASRIYASLDYFAHWQNIPYFKLDEAYKTYLAKAMATADRDSFTRASQEFLASMNNANTLLRDEEAIREGGQLPFQARMINGKWVVTDSWVTGLKRGDVIDTMDDRPFNQFVQDNLRYVSGSTDEGRRRLLFSRPGNSSPYAHLFPDQFELKLVGGRTIKVDRSDLEEAEQLHTEGRWIQEDKIAYIRIPSFTGDEFEKVALDLAKEYQGATALIVDVRGNSGGATPSDLTAFLMDRPYRWWTETVPVNVPFLQMKAEQGQDAYGMFKQSHMLWPSAPQQPPKEHFAHTLLILADAGCMSACEDFVMPFKDSYRALIVGETTAGSSGQPYRLDLGNGLLLFVGAKREVFPDGAQFEGVGIRPDMDVTPTVEDLRQGKDTVLEAARRSLSRTK